MVELHPRLQQDTRAVGETPLCWIRYMNDQRFPWLVIVPRLADVTEWHELEEQQQQQVLALVNQCAENLKRLTASDKINIGAIGNMVPQLHVHVIGRTRDDACWPAPVWGNGEVQPWPESDGPAWLAALRNCLAGRCA